MLAVERERFVPEALRESALADQALPIGHGATISQPYVVALMTELARVEVGARVLEIGTGSGYQAAILAELGAEVFSIERVAVLHARARALFEDLGLSQIETRYGDGFDGWPERAPFDAILLTAAPEELPEGLIEQLAFGGRLVAPVGPRWCQSLRVIERSEDETLRRHETDVTFVPMLAGLE